jgi:hypothetical protein
VQDVQRKLADNLGSSAASTASPSSLQLTMESGKLKSAVSAYETNLRSMVEATPDAIGFVVAINGKVSSADIYSSPDLFRAMWPKLLHATSVEALSEKKAGASFTQPTQEQVVAFLDHARTATPSKQRITSRVTLEKRESDKILASEAQLAEGGWVHRNYLAK